MEPRKPNRLPFHRQPAFRLLLVQLVVLLIGAATLWFARGSVAGYSGLLGGLIAWLPNLYFARKAFRYSGARSAQLMSGSVLTVLTGSSDVLSHWRTSASV